MPKPLAKTGGPAIASLNTEERYRLLVEAVTDYAIFMLDADGFITSWNPGAQRIKGYSSQDILGQHFSRFYTDEDRATGLPARALTAASREGKFENEGWRVRKDGSRLWAHVVIHPIRDASGALVGFAKITRDLTERRKAEEDLRRSQEQFQLLIQGVTDYAIYMIDAEGRVESWNSGAERLKGYSPDEIIGEHFSRFYTPEDQLKGEPARALAVARREGRFEIEGWRVRKDGTRFRASVVIDAIYNNDGSLRGFAKVTRDVTERFEVQQSLERAREALFQSQKMDAIGQLTGGVAHDFNNLLTAVSGGLELARKRLPDDPKISSLLDNAAKAAERGIALTQRMLAFARRQELDLKPVDIPALVRGMADLLQRSLGPAIAIETSFPLFLKSVMADTNQLELAILNLVVNARDAMPGGGRIVIAAQELDAAGEIGLKAGRYVCLSITDTGTGMDEATLAKAAEPFFTTKGVGKGTGLGLSMVHGLAEQLGGKLVLKSRPGQGTRAELWLSLVSATIDASSADGGQAIDKIESPKVSPRRSLRILAVDDDALVLLNTVAMLEDLGHKVCEAVSGQKALEILRGGEAIDLLLTDQAMPNMTGAELVEEVRRERPNLPVVVATGYSELPAGFDESVAKLAKPFTLADLRRVLDDARIAESKH